MLTTLLIVLAAGGCVRRRLTVRTNPPGALVYVDNQEIGYTPVSVPFTYYGTREIRLEKDGFETLTTKQKFKAPWYEWPVIEFFSENLWPGEIRDERVVDFQMFESQHADANFRARARNLREGARMGSVVPLPDLQPRNQGTLPLPAPRQPQPATSGLRGQAGDESVGPVFRSN